MAPVPIEDTVLITLDYLKVKNIAANGTVVFTGPRFPVLPDMFVTAEPVQVAVESGEASVRLIPTDAGVFQVQEFLDGAPTHTWHINIPTSLEGQTRSLFSFAPVQPPVQGVTVNTFLSGAGAPSNVLGIDGDFYYDTAAKFWYGPKANAAWPAGFSVVGPPGPAGPVDDLVINDDLTVGDDITAGGTVISQNASTDAEVKSQSLTSSDTRARLTAAGDGPNGRGHLTVTGRHPGFDGTQNGDGPALIELIGDNSGANPKKFALTVANSPAQVKLDVVNDGAGSSVTGVMRWFADGGVQMSQSGGKIGFLDKAPIAKPSVIGSRASGAALISLLTALADLGLITDNTSA